MSDSRPLGLSAMSPGEAFDAACRENELVAMAEAGQKLAIQWGHEPWSDSWARLVAETLDRAARNANHWRCEDCSCLNRAVDAFCYLCGAGQPEDDAPSAIKYRSATGEPPAPPRDSPYPVGG